MTVDLRHLRAFVAVAEELHFGRASQRLHLAQPAVTRTIQQLEVRLGEQLFERDKRHVALTGAGEALLVHASGILERANLVTDAVRGAAGSAAGRLTVGTVTHAPFGELTFPILNAFRQAAPETPLSMRELGFNEMDALALGSVDMLFTVQPWKDENIAWTPLALDPTVGMMSARHPLAEATELEASDLLDEPLPSPPPGMPAGFVEGHTLPEHRNGEAAAFAYSHPYRTAMEFADLIAAGSFWSPATLLVARRTLHPGVIYLPFADVAPMPLAVGIPAYGASETARRLVGVAQRVTRELIDLLPGATLVEAT